jgi:molybdopterin-synthase adenylyltransferase
MNSAPPPPSPADGAPALTPDLLDRFDRQMRFAPLGREAQERLLASRVLLVGCGGLGGILGQAMARVGIGELVLVDHDRAEPSNMPRQVLFDEDHAQRRVPKAIAAAEVLARGGGPTRCLPHVCRVTTENIDQLAEGCDLILDGTDDLPTRYLLNDHCIEGGRPWVFAGVVESAGLVLPVLPGRGACLRCVFPEPPPPEAIQKCTSVGVVLPAVAAVASMAAGLALRILACPDQLDQFEPALVELDTWNGEVRRIRAPRDGNCPACGRREFPFLHPPPPTPSR